MANDGRNGERSAPPFFLGESVNGQLIDARVRLVAEQLWPWTWKHVNAMLKDGDRAGEIVETIARRISRQLSAEPESVRSIPAVWYAAVGNQVKTILARESRTEYWGSSLELEAGVDGLAPEWPSEVELDVELEGLAEYLSDDLFEALCMRVMEETWELIGKAQGTSAGAARLRLIRALDALPPGVLPDEIRRALDERRKQ